MAQSEDVEQGISDLESVPLLPVTTPQLCQTSTNQTSTCAQKRTSQNKGVDDFLEDTEAGLADPDEMTRPGIEDEGDTAYDEIDEYIENPITKELLESIDYDDAKKIHRLLDSGADPNATHPLTPRQEEYLYRTAWDDDRDGCKKVPTWSGGRPVWSLLQHASASCRVAAVRALLARGARAEGALDVVGAAAYYGRTVQPHCFSATVSALTSAGARASPVAWSGAVTALHTAARLRCARAAGWLLRADAVYTIDADGVTPLHYAIQNKCEDTLQVLLETEGGRSAANMESASGVSALFQSVAAGWAAGCATLLRAGADADGLYDHPERPYRWWCSTETFKLTALHLATELNNTDIVDKILTLYKRKCIDCRDSEGETPLHTAIEYGHLACVKMLVRHGASLRNISGKRNALHIAAFYSYPNDTSILRYLVENVDVINIINELDDGGEGPIHRAVIAGAETVKILLDSGADVRLRIQGNDKRQGYTPLHFAGVMNDVSTARLIVDSDWTTIDDMDALGRTPLIIAVLNHAHGVVSAIIRTGALLSTYPKDTGKLSGIEMITTKLPDPTGFFERTFDWFFHKDGSVNVGDSVINYVLLMNESERNPLKVVEELVRCGQRKVLVHPLIETILYLKWSNLLPVYFFLVGTYAFFVLTLNVFVGMAFYYGDRHEEMSDSVIKLFWVDVAFLYSSTCFLIFQEWLQMQVRGARYWHSAETALTLASVALGAALPFWLSRGLAQDTDVTRGGDMVEQGRGAVMRHAASAAVLLAWLRMVFLLARFPRWGYYVLMMTKVSVDIAKILLTAVFLVLGFAMCFMIQFHATPPFDGPFAAFTKTLVMMASEFDYEDLFKDHDAVLTEKTVVRLLFILFLVFVSIVLMNFIVGVAVNDIHNLTVSGNVRRLQKQLELLSTIEVLISDGVLGKILPKAIVNQINNRRSILKMVINPGTTKIWTVHCGNGYNYEIRLPTYLYEVAVSKSYPAGEDDFNNKKLYGMVAMIYRSLVDPAQNVDPFSFREYLGIKVKSKLDDILQEMKKLNEVKDWKNHPYYDEERHRRSRQRSGCFETT